MNVDIHHIDKCPHCGSERFEKVFDCTAPHDDGVAFTLLKCGGCGFVFTQDVPVENEVACGVGVKRETTYSGLSKGLLQTMHKWVKNRMLKHKAKLLKSTSGLSYGRLLDITLHPAAFGDFMKHRGWRSRTVIVGPNARKGRGKSDDEWLTTGDLDRMDAESFDVITLWHTLEHWQGLMSFWENAHRLLHDRGILIVAVPNCTSYDARYYQAQWAAYDVPRHLWHFTPKTIHNMALEHGFILMKHTPLYFDTFYVAMLSEKMRQNSCALVRGLWVGIKALFATFQSPERGSSMIYVFRKK